MEQEQNYLGFKPYCTDSQRRRATCVRQGSLSKLYMGHRRRRDPFSLHMPRSTSTMLSPLVGESALHAAIQVVHHLFFPKFIYTALFPAQYSLFSAFLHISLHGLALPSPTYSILHPSRIILHLYLIFATFFASENTLYTAVFIGKFYWSINIHLSKRSCLHVFYHLHSRKKTS